MTFEIPKKIPEQRYEVLKLLSKKAYNATEAAQALPERLRGHLNKQMSMYVSIGLLERKPDISPATYKITAQGRLVLKSIDSIEIVRKTPYKTRNSSKKTISKTVQDISPTPPNISPLGDRLSGLASEVLMENEQYRNLLLEIHNRIEQALEIEKSLEVSGE